MTSSPFVFIGNALCVDFVNTELIEGDERVDLLASDRTVASWAEAAGLAVPSSLVRRSSPEQLDRSWLALRSALRALFETQLAAQAPSGPALATLNRVLAAIPPPKLVVSRGGLVREGAGVTDLPAVRAAIAEDALQLLTGEHVRRLRRCDNEHCILYFVDRSRRGDRRWCSMEICGNRAKVAAFQRRQRGK